MRGGRWVLAAFAGRVTLLAGVFQSPQSRLPQRGLQPTMACAGCRARYEDIAATGLARSYATNMQDRPNGKPHDRPRWSWINDLTCAAAGGLLRKWTGLCHHAAGGGWRPEAECAVEAVGLVEVVDGVEQVTPCCIAGRVELNALPAVATCRSFNSNSAMSPVFARIRSAWAPVTWDRWSPSCGLARHEPFPRYRPRHRMAVDGATSNRAAA